MRIVSRKGVIAAAAAVALALGIPLCGGTALAGGGGQNWSNIWNSGDNGNNSGFCDHHNCDNDNDADDANCTPELQNGDILVSTSFGTVLVYNSQGVLQQSLLPTGTQAPILNGSGFDPSGNFFVTEFAQDQNFTPPGTVFKYTPQGTLVGPFGSGYVINEETLTFDSTGDVIVGSPDDNFTVNGATLTLEREFDPNGNPITPAGNTLPGFLVKPDATGNPSGGADYVAMAPDNCTLYYNGEGTEVQMFNTCTNTQGGVFNTTPLNSAFEMVAFPTSLGGGLLVADGKDVVRLDSNGNTTQTYTIPGSQELYALGLDPSGTSFWIGDIRNGEVSQVDLTSGSVLTSFNATPAALVPTDSVPGVNGLSIDGAPSTFEEHDCSENGDEHQHSDDKDNSNNGNCFGHDKDNGGWGSWCNWGSWGNWGGWNN